MTWGIYISDQVAFYIVLHVLFLMAASFLQIDWSILFLMNYFILIVSSIILTHFYHIPITKDSFHSVALSSSAYLSCSLCSSPMETFTLNLPWKMTSRRKCGACCSDLEVEDGSTSTCASSAIVQSRQVESREKFRCWGAVCKQYGLPCVLLLSMSVSPVWGAPPLPLVLFSFDLPLFCSFDGSL